MELPEYWLTDPLLDAEYKHYKLLAFLKYVEGCYDQKRFFPYKEQVEWHEDSLNTFLNSLKQLYSSFPMELKGFDRRSGQMIYEPTVFNGAEVREIEKIVRNSIPVLKKNIALAEEQLAELKAQIDAFTIGVLPLKVQYGYLLLRQPRVMRVYEYKLKLVNDERSSTQLTTRYINTWPNNSLHNFEQIKLKLIKGKGAIANPATFGFSSNLKIPAIETYLPLAKQMAMNIIQKNYDQNTLSTGEK